MFLIFCIEGGTYINNRKKNLPKKENCEQCRHIYCVGPTGPRGPSGLPGKLDQVVLEIHVLHTL